MNNVGKWLDSLGLGQYAEAFEQNAIGWELLPKLNQDILKDIGVKAAGHRIRILDAAKKIVASAELPSQELPGSGAQQPMPTSEAERRQLTVMFCDLVGSTALSTRLDPEDLREVITTYQDMCRDAILRFDGLIARYMGDGLLVYFGYPQAHEDDAERAVRAGLALVHEVCELKPRDDIELQIRIGIATGLVVVGDIIGEGASEERAVLGDTPNMAARLQALAEPGMVAIGASTQQLTRGIFEFADLGVHALKGFSDPVRAWRVVREAPDESRFEARHAGELTPLVGRESEVALLLERWNRAKDGEGQVVLLSSEPGLGKSRIVRALRERLADESYTSLAHHCSPFHQSTALHPVIGQLERTAGFSRDDTVEDKLRKLESVLALASIELEEKVPLIATLLSIPAGDRYAPLSSTPQRQKQRTLEVLLDQVEGLARTQPVLAIYEDVHWIDPSTLEALGLLIERAQRLPLLVLITFRPEFTPLWDSHTHVTTLSLSRLAHRDVAAMVSRLTDGKALPTGVVEQIVERTDGVPLFVEELTKVVLESERLEDARGLAGAQLPFAIPTSLSDSLMARLDGLGTAKELAQIGAVVGRDFSSELLAAVASMRKKRLQDALGQLMRSGLVFRRGTGQDVTYSFKHALVQDAAYQSLLKATRRQLHGRIAQTLSQRSIGGAEPPPELIAEHFSRAGMQNEAVHCWLEAGQRAKAAYANSEATSHLEKCLSAVSKGVAAPNTPDAVLEQQATALALLGDLAGLAGDLDEANRRYDQALTRCRNSKLRTWIVKKHHHRHIAYREGAKIAYYTHGSGPKTLLFVNPLVYGLAVFQSILERLCQDFRVVTVDCRGTGNSDPLRRPYPLREHVNDVTAVIEDLGGEPVIGVGISRGSNLLIMLAVLHPQLISKIVSMSCPLAAHGVGRLPAFSPEFLRQRTEAYEREDTEALLRIQSAFIYTEPGTEELKRLYESPPHQSPLPPDTILSFYDPDPDADITPLLGQLTQPTLVTHGTADQLVSFAVAEYMAKELPNAQLYAFEDKGHIPMFTATDEFCDVLRSFV